MRGCPNCQAGGLELRASFKASPLGSFSLAGAEMKVSARLLAMLYCPACTWHAEGYLDRPEMDGSVFCGGYFVATEQHWPDGPDRP